METHFGEMLRKARQAAGRKLTEVAEHLGVSIPYISDVENRRRAPLSREKMLLAAQLFGIDPGELLAAAAIERGSFELDAKNPRTQELGAALMRGWKDLTDDQLSEIQKILQSWKAP